jgi:hypothetical protein
VGNGRWGTTIFGFLGDVALHVTVPEPPGRMRRPIRAQALPIPCVVERPRSCKTAHPRAMDDYRIVRKPGAVPGTCRLHSAGLRHGDLAERARKPIGAPASGTATLLNAHENPSERRPPARRSLKNSFKAEESIEGWMRQRLRERGAFDGGSWLRTWFYESAAPERNRSRVSSIIFCTRCRARCTASRVTLGSAKSATVVAASCPSTTW